MNNNQISCNLCWRIIFGIIYLLLSILAFIIIFFLRGDVFNLQITINNWSIYYRLLWCIAFSFLGFAVLILGWIVPRVRTGEQQDEDPRPTYPTRYLFLLLIDSLLVFGALNIFYANLGVLFYALSASISALLGFFIDSVPLLLHSMFTLFKK